MIKALYLSNDDSLYVNKYFHNYTIASIYRDGFGDFIVKFADSSDFLRVNNSHVISVLESKDND